MGHLLLAVTLAAPNALFHGELYVLVERYLDGDRSEAVTSLGAMDQAEVKAQVKAILRKVPSMTGDQAHGAPLFKAAVMLFTDRALLERAEGRIGPYRWNLDVAMALVSQVRVRSCSGFSDAMSSRSCAGCVSFARRWYLFAGLLYFATGEPSRSFFEKGLKQFPDDPRLLLALGTLEEKLGSTRSYGPRLDSGSQGIRSALDPPRDLEEVAARTGHLANAASYFRRALAADPHLLEARLRLGRVAFLQGHEESASEELKSVEHASREAATQYLAALFQGRVHEREGRVSQAAEAYRRAAGHLGDTPTAHVALAHALDVAGDRAGAADLLGRAVQPGDRSPAQDPWWTYLMGQSHEVEPLSRALHTEVRP
jgi:tetratricopeptide (TPR) repeat protein